MTRPARERAEVVDDVWPVEGRAARARNTRAAIGRSVSEVCQRIDAGGGGGG